MQEITRAMARSAVLNIIQGTKAFLEHELDGSQLQLAKAAHISPVTACRLFRPMPWHLETLCRAALALGYRPVITFEKVDNGTDR